MMLKVDGYKKERLKGRGKRMCLIGGIDDDNSKVTGGFFTQAKAQGVTTLCSLRSTCAWLTHSLYTTVTRYLDDRELTLQEQLINQKPLPKWAGPRRTRSDLDSSPPQAKGRIERLWNTQTGWSVNAAGQGQDMAQAKLSWSVTSPSTTASGRLSGKQIRQTFTSRFETSLYRRG